MKSILGSYYQPIPQEPIIINKEFKYGKREIYKVTVSSDEYDLAQDFSLEMKKRKGNNKGTSYFIDINKDDLFNAEIKTSRIGKLGEIGFGKIFLVNVDFTFRKFGDDSDFIIGNYRADLKNSSFLPKNEEGYVIKIRTTGKLMELKSDFYIFSYTNEFENRKEADINFVGWTTKEEVKKSEVKPGKGNRHLNYVIPYESLYNIKDLEYV